MRTPDFLKKVWVILIATVCCAFSPVADSDTFVEHFRLIRLTYERAKTVSFQVNSSLERNGEMIPEAGQRIEYVSAGKKSCVNYGNTRHVTDGKVKVTIKQAEKILIASPDISSEESVKATTVLPDSMLRSALNITLTRNSPDIWYYDMDISGSLYHHLRIGFDPNKWTIAEIKLDYSDMLTGEPCSILLKYADTRINEKVDESLLDLKKYVLVDASVYRKKKKKKKTDAPYIYPAAAYSTYQFINHLN